MELDHHHKERIDSILLNPIDTKESLQSKKVYLKILREIEASDPGDMQSAYAIRRQRLVDGIAVQKKQLDSLDYDKEHVAERIVKCNSEIERLEVQAKASSKNSDLRKLLRLAKEVGDLEQTIRSQ